MLRRLAFAATVVTALSAARPAAADGFYFFEGVGGSRYRDEVARSMGDAGLHIRGGIGWRLGHIAIEGFARAEIGPLTSHATGDTAARSTTPGGSDASLGGLAIVGLDLKVLQPLSTHWSAYARGGISKMMADDDYAGRGVGAAAGIQVAGKVRALGFLWAPLFFLNAGPKVHASLWFEASTSFHRLHANARPSLDARIDGWTLGFAVGQDF
jgi:hypothetical protein